MLRTQTRAERKVQRKAGRLTGHASAPAHPTVGSGGQRASQPAAIRVSWWALCLHVLALMFALIGILYVIPNRTRFMQSERAAQVYDWGLAYGGAAHIILGTVATLALGIAVIGTRRTGLFFGTACLVSGAIEYLGATTGWPFGAYEYTSFLGYKLLGEVPFTIPLSWFYMSLVAYLLGRVLVSPLGVRLSSRATEAMTIGIGAYLITVWDLVLEPAMAHERLDIRFWEWRDDGAYFGMPLQNYVGWVVTAGLIMWFGRLAWSSPVPSSRIPIVLTGSIFGVNVVFAAVLSLSVGLWLAPVLCLVLIALPVVVITMIVRRQIPDAAMPLQKP